MDCTINLSFDVLGLDGNPITDKETGGEIKAGLLLGNLLANSNTPEFSPIKAFDWATKLYRENVIKVDEADRSKLEKFVETSQTLTNLSKAQIIQAIQEAKNNPQQG